MKYLKHILLAVVVIGAWEAYPSVANDPKAVLQTVDQFVSSFVDTHPMISVCLLTCLMIYAALQGIGIIACWSSIKPNASLIETSLFDLDKEGLVVGDVLSLVVFGPSIVFAYCLKKVNFYGRMAFTFQLIAPKNPTPKNRCPGDLVLDHILKAKEDCGCGRCSVCRERFIKDYRKRKKQMQELPKPRPRNRGGKAALVSKSRQGHIYNGKIYA